MEGVPQMDCSEKYFISSMIHGLYHTLTVSFWCLPSSRNGRRSRKNVFFKIEVIFWLLIVFKLVLI